jgi:hypothetical protein
MKVVSSLIPVIMVGWLCGCTTAPKQIVTVPLQATTFNAGRIAQAVLTPLGNDTELVVFASGVPDGTVIPEHLYTYIYMGSCTTHESSPVYSLNEQVTDLYDVRAATQLWKKVPLGYDALRSGGYALIVRASPFDGNHDIFCGNLG